MIKKSSIPALPALPRPQHTENRMKELNHEFFLLVRDQKYEEALKIGELYLKFYPNNQAILQFCHFIRHNREELVRMVDEENNYTDQDSEEEEEDEDDEEDETESVASLESRASISTLKSKSTALRSSSTKSLQLPPSKKPLGKQNSELCLPHKWDHNCKNPNCPNRKKH